MVSIFANLFHSMATINKLTFQENKTQKVVKSLSPFQDLLHEILRRRDILLLACDGDDDSILTFLHSRDGYLKGCHIIRFQICPDILRRHLFTLHFESLDISTTVLPLSPMSFPTILAGIRTLLVVKSPEKPIRGKF